MDLDKIILGTVQLGKSYGINNSIGKPSIESSLSILSYAAEHGITKFDTADNYGESSAILNEFQKQNGHKFKIYSKAKLDGRSLKSAVQHSALLIGSQKLESFSLHDFSEVDHISKQDVYELKDYGFIDHFGVSVYTNEEILKASKLDYIDSIQIPFNLLDNWSRRGPAISFAKKMRKQIHCRSIFLQGLFMKDLTSLPTKLLPLKDALETVHKISKKHSITTQELALKYVLSISEIDQVLFGVESLVQLKENIDFISKRKLVLDDREIQNIKISNEELLSPTNWS